MKHAPNSHPVHIAPLLDALTLTLAGGVSWSLRFTRPAMENHYQIALLLAFLLALLLLPIAGAYRQSHWSHPIRGVAAAAPGVLLLFAGLMLVATMTKSTADFSRVWIVGWGLLAITGMAAWRGLARPLFTPSTRRILLLGSGQLACATAQHLFCHGQHNQVVGMLTLPGEPPVDAATLPIAVLGEFDDLERILGNAPKAIDELWLTPDITHPLTNSVLQAGLQQTSLPVRYVPDLTLLRLLQHRISNIHGLTVIELNATPLDGPEALVKAVLDRTVAALMLLALLPLLLLIAAIVRIDSPGPALFSQPRHGGGGRIIRVLKFRTMRGEPDLGTQQAQRDDPRITRIGVLLRRSSLDELPQLYNVLRGDMSLVGPRPHPLALNAQYRKLLDTYMQRHRVKPGITGWAQINGYRGETDTLEKMQKRLEYDLYYIENWSLALDLKILAKTAVLGWGGRNAY
jgi:Undecaprenyl-phosphate glucose phosphotransferase